MSNIVSESTYDADLAEYNQNCELDKVLRKHFLDIYHVHYAHLNDDDECECEGDNDLNNDSDKSEAFLSGTKSALASLKDISFDKYPNSDFINTLKYQLKNVFVGFEKFDKTNPHRSYYNLSESICAYYHLFENFKKNFVNKHHKFELQQIYKVRLVSPGKKTDWKFFADEEKAHKFLRESETFFKDFNDQDFRKFTTW